MMENKLKMNKIESLPMKIGGHKVLDAILFQDNTALVLVERDISNDYQYVTAWWSPFMGDKEWVHGNYFKNYSEAFTNLISRKFEHKIHTRTTDIVKITFSYTGVE